jgi:hypothetical protein
MNRQELEYWSRKYGITLLMVLAIIAFLVPLILRATQGSPITPGAQSYTYLRHAQLLEHGTFGYDPLEQVFITPEPYVALLTIMQIFGVPWLLPVLLALLLVLLLYHYLERMVPVRTVVVLAIGVVIISPVMSVLATQHTGILLALDLLLAALLLFDARPTLASILITLMIITQPVLGLLASLYIVIVYLREAKYHAVIGIMLAVAIASAWFILWSNTLPYELSALSLETDLFFELGNSGGITIFALILAAYAIVLKFDKLQPLIVPTLMLFFLTFFLPALMPITAIALSLFAGHAIFLLITHRWELELLRESLVVLIACIGIFLLITTMRERVQETPDTELSHMMTNLRNQYREGNVLTHSSYAPMVEYFTGKRVVAQDELLLFRDASVVYPALANTQTSYVLMTDEMEQMFSHSEEGMLFLLQNSGRFVKLAENEENTLWYFIKT